MRQRSKIVALHSDLRRRPSKVSYGIQSLQWRRLWLLERILPKFPTYASCFANFSLILEKKNEKIHIASGSEFFGIFTLI